MGEPDDDQELTPHEALVRRSSGEADDSLSPERRAARRAADSIRELISRLADTAASASELDELADRLDAAAAALSGGATSLDPDGALPAGGIPAELERLIERSPIVGLANPVAPPLRVEAFDDRIVGHVRFSAAYVGPVGRVHGGYIAAVFDELLGSAQLLSGRGGMTGRLIVHYRSPPPLETELRFEARFLGRDGRKILCEGSMWSGEQLCAEAEGLFVTVDPERYAQLTDGQGGSAPDGTGSE